MSFIIKESRKNIVAQGEIACFEQFLLCHNVFKSSLLQMRPNASASGKGLNIDLKIA